MPRPFWSGHIQISLVSFGVHLFPATEAASEIHFHQLNRKTGERVRHQNVSSEEEPLDKEDIVKGYEYTKGEYVMIEPEDIENLRIPSRQTLQVAQFVDRDALGPELFEKPYFVAPENASQSEAFAVVRKAMQASRKVALGKIAFGGREHLLAVAAPEDDSMLGMMAYTLRYAAELRDPAEFMGEIKKVSIDKDQLNLAQELIKRKSAPFKPEQFTDEYEAALRAMVDAKAKNVPLPKNPPAKKTAKVINLMDALRKSVQTPAEPEAASAKSAGKAVKPASGKKVSPITAAGKSRSVKANSKRKSA
jgi:DNA end-binding protein Ku